MDTDGRQPVLIRTVRATDGCRCAEIFLEGRRQAFCWQPPEAFRLEDYEPCVEGQEVWVAELNGEIVGFVSLCRPEHIVYNVFVDPRWQHRGIGRRLLDSALQRMTGAARLHCDVRNTSARAFYAAVGWTMEPRRNTPALDPFIVYRKDTGWRRNRHPG